MRHINYVLKPATMDNAKPKDKRYDLTDGGGLVLEVMPAALKAKHAAIREAPDGQPEPAVGSGARVAGRHRPQLGAGPGR